MQPGSSTKVPDMTVTVRIPTVLREYTAGASTVPAEGATVREVLSDLDARHHGVLSKVLDDQGRLRRYVNVFVGEDDVRALGGLEMPVPDGAEVSIIPSVAGG